MTALALLPGLGNTAALFDRILPGLGEREILHIDLTNATNTDFSMLCAQALDQIGGRRVDLVGFSMGGYVAQSLALSNQMQFRSLSLLHTRPEPDGEQEAAARQRTLRLLRNAKTRFEGMTPSLFAELVHPKLAKDRPMFNFVRDMAQAVGRQGLMAQLQAISTRPDFRNQLARLILPTLIIGGAEDQRTPPSSSLALRSEIKGAELHLLPNCGHLGPLERPLEMAAHLRGFLNRL